MFRTRKAGLSPRSVCSPLHSTDFNGRSRKSSSNSLYRIRPSETLGPTSLLSRLHCGRRRMGDRSEDGPRLPLCRGGNSTPNTSPVGSMPSSFLRDLLVSDLVGDLELISVLIRSFMMSANEQDCVRALIEMYRSLPCLWKIKSADYSNRYKKKDAYEKLVAIYKEHHPTETVDEHIVRSPHSLQKELNKVEKSLKSGAGTDDVYVPKLWYYDLLAFTRDQEIPRPCQTVTSICAPSPEENLPESRDEHVPLQQRERPEGNDVQSHQSSRSPCLEDQTRPQRPSRKRKSTAGTPVDLLAMANNILSKHAATQLSAFPTLVEEQLNKLDVTQRSHVERLMFDVLNAAAAGKLSDTSMLNITDRQPSSQFYLGPPQEPMHSSPVRRPGPHHSQFWTPPAPPSFADFSQGPPTSTHRYSEMDTYYQNL
ncbi:unnamed protein product [Ranitomeya imitator]|uniref:MADF domain-containing protein n=1 Tax=Ranitomeya imitator TaxID=111125 RepID=A0ABN9M403_9NEOB|nr:unnamed protein product [Ranitomeya imitator]